MNNETLLSSLFSFLENSPTPFHATACLRQRLLDADFSELEEGSRWDASRKEKCFVTRNGALIAFSLNSSVPLTHGLRIIGAHTDSPALQIKPNLRKDRSPYLTAGVEVYGGALLRSWFDRELSLAGRISYRSTTGGTGLLLVNLIKPVVYIPSLAIHLDRKINEGREINVQNDLCPIIGLGTEGSPANLQELLLRHIADTHQDSSIDSILGYDLFCYDIGKPSFCGIEETFISGPRLDNLLSCHIGVEALCQSDGQAHDMLICMNHEEIGSTTHSGALGNFPAMTIARLLPDPEERAVCLHRSMLLSLDNAHATHPNFSDKSDGSHEILLNHGPVIKINAAQRYSSTARTAAIFRIIAGEAGVKTQDFVMRSDMPCGSTIGPLSSARLGIEAIDVGAATWGMHSIREMTGAEDPHLLFQAACHFFNRPSLPTFRERW